MSAIRRNVRTSTIRTWEWSESWGPQITDVTQWSVAITGKQVHLRRGAAEISMSREVAAKVLEAMSEALAEETS